MSTIRYPESPLLKQIAHRLVELYDDVLFHQAVKPEAILFIEDTTTKAKLEKIDEGKAKIFDVKELHPALAERLNADYMVIYYKLNGAELDGDSLNAYFVEALMRIKHGGGLQQPDVKTFVQLAKTLGADWKQRQFLAADILGGDLRRGATGQAKLDLSSKEGELAARLAEVAPLDKVVTIVREVVHGEKPPDNVRQLRPAESNH